MKAATIKQILHREAEQEIGEPPRLQKMTLLKSVSDITNDSHM